MDSARRSHRYRTLNDLHTSAKTWRSRSGRTFGPDEYVVGDVVSSVFLRSRTLTQRERQELYGCPVLLVGIYSASGFADTTPSTKLYISLRTTDSDGAEVRSGRLTSHVVMPSTDPARPPGTFDFDEVLTLGSQGDLASVDQLTIRVKQLHGAFRGQQRRGEIKIRLKQLISEACAEKPPFEALFDVGAPAGAGPVLGTTVGCLHVRFFVHFPPPDPAPCAVHVKIVEGRGLLPRDMTGLSDPYVQVRPILHRSSNLGARDAWGRAAEFRSTTQTQTLNPTWPDHVAFVDSDIQRGLGERLAIADPVGFDWSLLEDDGATERTMRLHSAEKLAPDRPPHAPGSARCARIPCEDLGRVQGLELRVMDWDAVSADDDMGEAYVSFSSLFGDEDAVIGSHSLTVRKWIRVSPTRSLVSSGIHLGLGHILVHISLAFEQALLPVGWQEAVDAVTGREYFYCARLGRSQWEEPAELLGLRLGVAESESLSSASAAGPAVPAATDSDVCSSSPSNGNALSSRAGASETTIASSDKRCDKGETTESVVNSASGIVPVDEGRITAIDSVDIVAFSDTSSRSVVAASPKQAPASPYVAGRVPETDDDDEDLASLQEAGEGVDDFSAESVPVKVSSAASVVVPEYVNPLTREARKTMPAGDRDTAFFSQMRSAAETRKRAEEDRLQAKLAAMTPEERVEHERERASEVRREARKSRMLQTTIGAYATTNAQEFRRSRLTHRTKSGREHGAEASKSARSLRR